MPASNAQDGLGSAPRPDASGTQHAPSERLRLAAAVALPLATLAMQWVLWPWIQPFVWFLFFPTVFFSARLGGYRSGLISTALSAAIVWFFFISPQLSWKVEHPANLWSVGLFLLVGYLVSETQARLENAIRTRENALEQSRLAQGASAKANFDLRELSHHLEARVAERTQALRASERLYQSLVEQLPQSIFRLDREGRITFANSHYCQVIGREMKDLLGKTQADFFPPDQAVDHTADSRRVMESGEVMDAIKRHVGPGGQLSYVHVVKSPLRDDDDQVIGLQGVFMDVTASKQAEIALGESERRFRSLVTLSPVAMGLVNRDGAVSFLNDRFTQLFGYTADDIPTLREWWQLAYPNETYRRQVEATWTTAINHEARAHGAAQPREWSVTCKDGTVRIVQISSIAVGDGILACFIDLTERKWVEESLRASEERFRQVVEAAPEAIFIRTGDQFTYLNAAALRLLGAERPEQLLGQSVMDRFHPDFREVVRERIRLLDDQGQDTSTVDRLMLRLDGSPIAVIVSAVQFTFQGQPSALVFARDITARKQAEEALRASELKARQRAEEIQTLMNLAPLAIWVAHDPACQRITGNHAANAFYEADADENVSAGPATGGEQNTARRFFQNGRELAHDELPMQQAVRENRDIRASELTVVRPSGKTFTMLGNASPLRDEQGRVRGCIGCFVDITERKLAEESVRVSEEKFRRVIESNMFGVAFWQADGQLTDANQAFCNLIGCSPAEVQAGRVRWNEVTPPELLQRDRQAIEEFNSTGICRPYEKEFIHRDGHRVPILIGAAMLGEVRDQGVLFAIDITERKRAELAVRESELRLRTVGDNIPGGALYQLLMPPDGRNRYTYLSAGFERIFGIPVERVLAEPMAFWDMIVAEDRPRIEAAQEHAARTMTQFDCEFRQRTANAEVKWIHACSMPRRLEDGSILWDGVAADISERKRVEHRDRNRARTMELLASGKPLPEVLMSIALAAEEDEPTGLCSVLLVDETGQRLLHGAAPSLPDFYNRAINGIAIGDGVGSCGTAAHRKQRVVVGDIQTAPDWKNFRELAQRAGLRACWSEPILASDGLVLGTFAIYHREPRAPTPHDLQRIEEAADVASLAIERERAESALRTSEEEFRSLAEAMPQIVWVTRADGWNIYYNRQWFDYTGLTLEQSHGHGWNKPFHPDDQQRAWDAWQRATKHLDTYSLECRLRRADGIYRWWLIRGVPFVDENGKILKWFGTCTDIEDMKQAADEIRRLNTGLEQRVRERTTELEAANRELESFAYAVSHDLRAPLRAMSGFSHALREDYGTALAGEGMELLDEINQASRKMGSLIDGLLTLSRSTRGELRRETVDLSAMAGRILAGLARVEPDRRVAWSVQPGLCAHCDERTVEVVLNNLLGNAWKYTARTPEAKIEFGMRNAECRTRNPDSSADGGTRQSRITQSAFYISDNGAGFDPRHAAHLFQAFQRLHRQDEFPGLGIGLATVQRIIHRHGGSIDASAEPSQGATFWFTLNPDQGITEEKA